jgi:hypothetical protein
MNIYKYAQWRASHFLGVQSFLGAGLKVMWGSRKTVIWVAVYPPAGGGGPVRKPRAYLPENQILSIKTSSIQLN